jgi:hypothetical protein
MTLIHILSFLHIALRSSYLYVRSNLTSHFPFDVLSPFQTFFASQTRKLSLLNRTCVFHRYWIGVVWVEICESVVDEATEGNGERGASINSSKKKQTFGLTGDQLHQLVQRGGSLALGE